VKFIHVFTGCGVLAVPAMFASAIAVFDGLDNGFLLPEEARMAAQLPYAFWLK